MTATILHVAYSGSGGVGELAVELARRADARRFSSAVCFFGVEPAWGSFRERLDTAGIEWSYVPLPGRLACLWRLFRRCVEPKPDLVVAHGSAAMILPLLRIARPGCKCIAVFHGPPAEAQLPRGILRLLPGIVAAHRIVCVGAHLARLLQQNLHWRAQVIPNGVQIPALPSQRVPGEILMLANLSPSKDHRTLLEAVALLACRRSDFRLVLAGDGPLRHTLERQAETLGLGSRVEFLGAVSNEEKLWRLSCAALYVQPTHGEGCPMAVLEAMAFGCPIVASRVAGVTELLEDGRTALLVPPRDPAALAAALASLLDAPERAARLGQAAQLVARRDYSIQACVRAYEKLFDSLLEPAAGRVPGSTRQVSTFR